MITRKLRATTIAFTTALLGALMVSTAALAWDGSFQGDPDALDHGATGYFLWHNGDGLHLRTHDTPRGSVYQGVLRTDGTFQDVNLVRAESTEDFRIDDGGHTLRFRFRTYEHIDGLDFRIDGGSHLRLDLEKDGHQILPRHIYLGDAGRHPATNPFTLRR